MNFIFPIGDYVTNSMAGVDTLESRRERLTKRLFMRSVIPEESRLHYVLPVNVTLAMSTNCAIPIRFIYLLQRLKDVSFVAVTLTSIIFQQTFRHLEL